MGRCITVFDCSLLLLIFKGEEARDIFYPNHAYDVFLEKLRAHFLKQFVH